MLPYRLPLLFLFLAFSEAVVSDDYIMVPALENKIIPDPLFGNRHSDSVSVCALLCVDACRYFSFNFQSKMCRHYCQWNSHVYTHTESGWRTYKKISLKTDGECMCSLLLHLLSFMDKFKDKPNKMYTIKLFFFLKIFKCIIFYDHVYLLYVSSCRLAMIKY